MGKAKSSAKPADTSPPAATATQEIYAASCGQNGIVQKIGKPITQAIATQLRQTGSDVVVCGPDVGANRRLAKWIEMSASGNCVVHPPHASAGAYALPHCQPDPRPPQGHTFYETANRKAV